jgi:enoyl-CoA hydratase
VIERTDLGDAIQLRMAHGKVNALDLELLRELTARFGAEVGSSKPVILTGTGAAFSAGVDLIRLAEGGADYVREFIPALSRCFFTLFSHPAPVVAALNGHAIAGGCLIACACDRRILVRDSARIGVPELRVGVPFPWLALELLRFAVPMPHAQEMALLGGTYAAEEALRRGLVDELCEAGELRERARAVARALGAAPGPSFRTTKALLRGDVIRRWKESGSATDARTIELWCSDEVRASVKRYVETTLRAPRG